MENLKLNKKIITGLENLILDSCTDKSNEQQFRNMHFAILKKCYNAASVTIDYHRKRVTMEIILDEDMYNPQKINTFIPTLHTNIHYQELSDFLKESLLKDNKSIAFYASLLCYYSTQDAPLIAV